MLVRSEAQKTEGGGAGGEGSKSPSVPDPKQVTPGQGGTPPVNAGAGGTPGANGGGGEPAPKKVRLADGDEIPDDAELIELSQRALKSRLDRHTKKELRDRFGTDDPEEIKAKLDRLAEMEKKAEEDRRKSLSEQEKMKEDLAREKSRAEAAETRAREAEERRVYERENDRILRIAERHLDSDVIDAQLPNLAKYLRRNFSKKQLAEMTPGERDKTVEKWFTDLVKDKPKFGKNYEPEKRETRKEGATNGAKDPDNKDKPIPSGGAGGRNYAPGKGMTRDEARKSAADEGYRW